MDYKMKFIQYVEEQDAPSKRIFSINKESLEEYISKSEIKWDTVYGLFCDDETFRWFEENTENGILIVTPENVDKLKTFHFYKEIILF